VALSRRSKLTLISGSPALLMKAARFRRSEIHSFFPGDREGGSVSRAGQIALDSGLMNPDLLANGYDQAAQKA
jgi:hypothetical protein